MINQDGEGFQFAAKRLTAAVVTQLFSYMIGKGIRYRYVCTGETFVFLRIPYDDPSYVYYSVYMPNLNVQDDDDDDGNRGHDSPSLNRYSRQKGSSNVPKDTGPSEKQGQNNEELHKGTPKHDNLLKIDRTALTSVFSG